MQKLENETLSHKNNNKDSQHVLQHVPFEIIVEQIFTYVVNFNEFKFGKQILNLCLICKRWANCFYSLNDQELGIGELFWRVWNDRLRENIKNKDEFISIDSYNQKSLFLLNSFPIVRMNWDRELFFDGPIIENNINIEGFPICKVDCVKNYFALGCLRLVLPNLALKLQEKKHTVLHNSRWKDFVTIRNTPSFDLVGNQVLKGFEYDYAKVFNERMDSICCKSILQKYNKATPGDLIVSNAKQFVHKFSKLLETKTILELDSDIFTSSQQAKEFYNFKLRKMMYS